MKKSVRAGVFGFFLIGVHGFALAGCGTYDPLVQPTPSTQLSFDLNQRAKLGIVGDAPPREALLCGTSSLPIFRFYEVNRFSSELERVEVWGKSTGTTICRGQQCDPVLRSMADTAARLLAVGLPNSAAEASKIADKIAAAKEVAEGTKMPCPQAGENFNPGYYQRAMKYCISTVKTAFSPVATDFVASAACAAISSNIANTFNGTLECKN